MATNQRLPLGSVWLALVIGIPALAIAFFCTLFAVAYTGPQFDIEILDDRVVGGASDRVIALVLATGFGALGIFSLLNLRTRISEWRRDATKRPINDQE